MKKLLPLLLFSLLAFDATAQTPAEKGLQIAREADSRNDGFADSSAKVVMTLKDRRGREAKRFLRTQALEMENDGDRNLIIFDQPRDIRGTALLTWTHKVDNDDQWLYLPAIKRVKRISGRNISGPFVGSEFAYEDLAAQEVEKYTYRYVKDEACGEQQCYVIERFPVNKNSGYVRQVVWMDKAEYRIQKVDYYDRKQSLLKTLTAQDYKQYKDRYWRADRLSMLNHQTGKSTELLFSEFVFQQGLRKADFHRNSLKRLR